VAAILATGVGNQEDQLGGVLEAGSPDLVQARHIHEQKLFRHREIFL